MIALIPVALILILAGVFVANNRPPNIAVPTPKMPKDNGWDYFARAGEMIGNIGQPGPLSDASRKPEEWTVAELEAFVNANEPALAMLREGLTKPYRHPLDRDPIGPSPEDPLFSHYVEFRDLARVLAGESVYYRRRGLYARAANAQLDAVEMGVILPKGGSTLTMLTAVAIESIGKSGIHEVIARLDAQELAQVARRLETIQCKRWPVGDNITEDGYIAVTEAARFLDGSEGFSQAWDTSHWTFSDDDIPRLQRYWQSTKFALLNKQRLLQEIVDYSHAMAKECNGPFQERSRVPVPDNRICQVLAENCRMAHHTYCRAQGWLSLIQLEVALRRWELDFGSYPAKLSDLAPKYLAGIPVDPFGGRPLKYTATKGGDDYPLYSIGPNLKDDHGKPGECRTLFEPEDLVAGEY